MGWLGVASPHRVRNPQCITRVSNRPLGLALGCLVLCDLCKGQWQCPCLQGSFKHDL